MPTCSSVMGHGYDSGNSSRYVFMEVRRKVALTWASSMSVVNFPPNSQISFLVMPLLKPIHSAPLQRARRVHRKPKLAADRGNR
jgi:hypothetical protein